MKKKTALVVGATSLVGKELVNLLLTADEYEKIIIWVRRSIGIHHGKLEEKLINFEMLDTYEIDENVQHLFCCLGTTIKQAGTAEGFKTVDYEYPLVLARKAKAASVLQFIVISALGATANSKIFYNRTKGEMEEGVKALDLPGLQIIRPSLLLGKREEFRMGEQLAAMMTSIFPFLFMGSFKKYKPIPARQVAYAMYKVANIGKLGKNIYESDSLVALNKV